MQDQREIMETYFGDLFADFSRYVERDSWGSKTFLDFGCGNPGYCLQYRRHFAKGYALDIQDLSTVYAHEEKITFLQSDGATIPLPDDSVHYVFSHSTLEHVSDLETSLREIHRVLKTHSIAYLTVSPLYYAPQGGHQGLSAWEHLDPSSPHYLDDRAADQNMPHNLNRLNVSKLLGTIGKLPFNILNFTIKPDRLNRPRPDFIPSSISDMDVHTREFRLVVKKMWKFRDGQAIM